MRESEESHWGRTEEEEEERISELKWLLRTRVLFLILILNFKVRKRK